MEFRPEVKQVAVSHVVVSIHNVIVTTQCDLNMSVTPGCVVTLLEQLCKEMLHGWSD